MTKEQIEKLNKEYKELSTIFGNLSEKFKEIKGNYTAEKAVDAANIIDDLVSNVSRRIDYIHQRIDSLSNDLYDHKYSGHIPPIKSVEQMNKALKSLGLDSEYDVAKRTIFASVKSNNRNPVIEVAYSPLKTA